MKGNIFNKMKDKRNITDRKQLKSFFTKGSLPNDKAFERLIDSTFNKADDKLDINDDGLMIYPSDNGKEKLLSFFEDQDDISAMWAMYISKKQDGGIYISKVGKLETDNSLPNETDKNPAFFIQKDGERIGLGTNSPAEKLDVRGIVASNGRSGNYHEGELPADGEWHNVFANKDLTACNAYEIMAYAEGDVGDGKYALMHAIAISTFGNSKPNISKTAATFGKRWNNISIRWESRPSVIKEGATDGKKEKSFGRWWKQRWETKDTFKYNIQLKTNSNYGKGRKIHYKVSVLWDKNFIRKS